jgi:hypothetical protein
MIDTRIQDIYIQKLKYDEFLCTGHGCEYSIGVKGTATYDPLKVRIYGYYEHPHNGDWHFQKWFELRPANG